jgi:hypothetical protein
MKPFLAMTVITVAAMFLAGCTPGTSKEAATTQPHHTGRSSAAVETDSHGFILGQLGYPLGTYLMIEGTRAEKGGREIGFILLVDKINSKSIDPPVPIVLHNLSSPLPTKERCVLCGYECGRMMGLPYLVARAEKLSESQATWQFYRYFIVTSVVQPPSLQLGSDYYQ